MQLSMYDNIIASDYKSNSQVARILTENWLSSEMYCPCCLAPKIFKYPNNQKVKDFFCEKCKNDFQLKAQKKKIDKKIIDGNFQTMINAIESDSTPNFLIMEYSIDWFVESLLFIPKFFISTSIIEQRKPLSITAKRHGWIGCNILLENLPNEGKIEIIKHGKISDKIKINKTWKRMLFMTTKKSDARGWTADVLKIIQEQDNLFKLEDIYKYESYLKELHPENHNIQAKIRQQLQTLRDNKIISFNGKGIYQRSI